MSRFENAVRHGVEEHDGSCRIDVAARRIEGDVLEVVSHDRAFDAVGDAAARLGVTFRRITYRATAATPSRTRGGRGKRRSATKPTKPRPAPPAASGAEPVAASADQLRRTIDTLTRGGGGTGVSLDANRLAIGASKDDGSGNVQADSGAVYLLSFTDNGFANPTVEARSASQ